jgi:hypothetical protein
VGRSFGERYAVAVTGLNVANRCVLTDNSLTFGGFHYNDPREIYVEFRYRFHYQEYGERFSSRTKEMLQGGDHEASRKPGCE